MQKCNPQAVNSLSVIILLLMLPGLFSGCSVAPLTPEATAAPVTAAAGPGSTAIGSVRGGRGALAGVELNVLTFTGPQIAEPLQRHAKEFAANTGATVHVTTVPFSDLYQTILTDLSTGTHSFDVFVFDP